MSMLCNTEQLANAYHPIVVTLLGILMLCNAKHPLKTHPKIVVILLGISMFCNAVQF